jgi:hypothetical protein
MDRSNKHAFYTVRAVDDPTPDRKARRGLYPRCVPIVPDSSTWHLFFLGVAPVAAPGPTTRHHRWATKSSIYLRGILPPGWSCGLGGNERAVHQRRPPRLSASILRCCGSILTNLGGMNRASGRGTERPGAFALAPGGDSGAVPMAMLLSGGMAIRTRTAYRLAASACGQFSSCPARPRVVIRSWGGSRR